MKKHHNRWSSSPLVIGGTRQSRLLGSLVLCTTLFGQLGCDEKQELAATTVTTKPADPAAIPAPMNTAPEPVIEPAKPKKTLADCPRDNKLVIENADLQASIRVKAQKPDGVLTTADLKKLRSLNLSRVELDQLDICLFSHMTELRELFIAPTGIDDLSPISGAKHMETLGVAGNPISDLSPLEKMTNLDRLDLAKTKVSDLSALSQLTKLTELTLDGSEVTELTSISGLSELERLSIKSTQIKDLKPLTGLKKLKFLYLADSAAASDMGQTGPIVQNGTKVIED